MLPKNDVLHNGLSLFQCLLEKSHTTSKTTIVFRVINILVMSIITTLTMINFLHVKDEKMLENVEAFTTELHVFGKYLTYIYFKSDFARFLDEKEMFWKLDNFEPNVQRTANVIYKFVNTLLRVLIFTAFGTAFLFLFGPLTKETPLIFESWLSNNLIPNVVVLALQYYFLSVAALTVIAFDCVFAALSAHLVVQLKLLNFEFQSLYMDANGDSTSDFKAQQRLVKCVQYQQFLLRFFFRMRRMYSPLFLGQYFVTLLTTCMEMYTLSVSATNVQIHIIKTFFYISTMIWEFGFYCFPAQYVKFEISDLSNGLYQSKWYESKLKYQKDILLMMMKSQKQQQFTAGGFMEVNVQTFASVFKTSFTFYTLMKSVFD